jgi:hypothetical protein
MYDDVVWILQESTSKPRVEIFFYQSIDCEKEEGTTVVCGVR